MGEQDNPQEQNPGWEARFQRVDDLQDLAAMEEEEPFSALVGQTLAGHFEITALLGHGGMGAVYRAHDTRLDRTVAIKTILPNLLSGRQASHRFFREVRTIALWEPMGAGPYAERCRVKLADYL